MSTKNTCIKLVNASWESVSSRSQIRNFSIIAHIDHGKSTLADRMIEMTGALAKREMQAQVLDQLEIERERGITIKAQTARLNYKSSTGQDYIFNLIDTPGHVDFHYEVSRSLAACEGAILVVDASQGVQAQTIANVYKAIDLNLTVIPVLNKIDLPNANPERVLYEIEHLIGLDPAEAILISAKTGQNVDGVLQAIAQRIPPPQGAASHPLAALIIDSWFDSYQGVVALVRVFDGQITRHDHVRLMSIQVDYEVDRLGVFTPHGRDVASLAAGEVGFVVAGIKKISDARVGDTITHTHRQVAKPLTGFKQVKPMVFCGLYPTDSEQYDDFKVALEKLTLNDAALFYEPESSQALGFGFRCGFLGLLHMDVIRERLEREYQLALISTAPTVVYKIFKTNGEVLDIDSPAKLPATGEIDHIEEPVIAATIYIPAEFVGAVLKLCEERRGTQKRMEYITGDRVLVVYLLPLAEVVFDFYDKLKSLSRGYASFDYEPSTYQTANLVRLDIHINQDPVDALSLIVHREHAYPRGRELVSKLREIIPRQQFEVAIQAVIGAKPIARETVSPLRKNVTAKCYGGDITRKRKLLEKQKAGKKRMKQVGAVHIPQEAFLAVLDTGKKR